MLVCSLIPISITITDLWDLKTILQEVRPTGNVFWINVGGENDRGVKGQNVVFETLSIFLVFLFYLNLG